eukprot:3710921-Pyramimonas_sp.AAC.1
MLREPRGSSFGNLGTLVGCIWFSWAVRGAYGDSWGFQYGVLTSPWILQLFVGPHLVGSPGHTDSSIMSRHSANVSNGDDLPGWPII